MSNLTNRSARTSGYTVFVLVVVGLLLVASLMRNRQRQVEIAGGATDTPAIVPPSAAAKVTGPDRPLRPVATKPRPVSPGFRGCPAEGDGGDRDLNRLKNRVDSAAWRSTSVDAILALGWPRGVEGEFRRQWSRAETEQVAKWEGIPVSIEGYVAGAKQSGPESTNCHGADAGTRDWHVWLAGAPGTDRTHAIVAEPTPIVRAMHPEWTLEALRTAQRAGALVRMSGWLLLDPEHPDQVGKTRGTIWEIHPLMRIEVQRGGVWIPLDSRGLAPARRRRSR